MRRLFTTVSLLCLSFSLLATSAAAQTESSELLQQLPGLETAWGKRYDNPAMHSHLLEATPAAVSTRLISASVLEFDSEESATLTFAMALNDDTVGMILGVDASAVAASEEVELGDQATLFTASEDDEASALLAIRDGNLGFLVSAWGPTTEDAMASVEAVGAFMVDAEPGTGEIVFEQYGESSGGLFDLFPRNDDQDVLQGMVPMYEYNLMISDSPIDYPATPAA